MFREPHFVALLIASALFFSSCQKNNNSSPLFEPIAPAQSGVSFNNTILENDTLNVLATPFIYNGGGVGVGDFDSDGRPDLFFTGSQVDNKLYLNRGDFHFDDVSEAAGIQKKNGQWSAGVNVLDLNRDGLQDIYVCNTFLLNATQRQNQLFINQGKNAAGIPVFKDMAAAYGIADDSHTSNAQFFDFDNDGDLDLFIATNEMDSKTPNRYIKKVTDGSSPNTDRLYRNDWDTAKNHPVFTEITKMAGIQHAGFSHSALPGDFNEDGWLDMYVANDFVSNDLLYINNGKGGFENKVDKIFKHQAGSAMGSDFGDINADGRLDLFTTEMMPYYNKRKKLFLGQNNYTTYINNESYGYEYQVQRNTLQLNQGLDPETGLPVYSDVGQMTGTSETDWSWSPLFADFDNDGLMDLFVSNGFPRDVTDHDFGNYLSTVVFLMSPMDFQDQIPRVKVPNFLFKNQGNFQFSNIAAAAGLAQPSFSNGAAEVDFDGDGDLDLVLNNINDPAFIGKNKSNDGKIKPHFLRISLEGRPENPDAIGAEVRVYFDGKVMASTVLSARGYLSCPERTQHFGLGTVTKVDSVIVYWGKGEQTVLRDLPLDKTSSIKYASAVKIMVTAARVKPVFEKIDNKSLGLDLVHTEPDFVDFNVQNTLPRKFSEIGPSLSIGDITGDGLEDIISGGTASYDAMAFIQQKEGKFLRRNLQNLKTLKDPKIAPQKLEEDVDTELFDADGDGDLDLYLVRGGSAEWPKAAIYQDQLCINDGKGNFSLAGNNVIPRETSNGSCVRAADFDGDGDLDLFIGGSVMPFQYPLADRSFLLRNDTKTKGNPVFTDVSKDFLPEIEQLGIVNDALWSDLDGDKKPELIIAAEWQPLLFFKNNGKKLTRWSVFSKEEATSGWWSRLTAADFDGDGDTDLVAGNFGKNTAYQCSVTEPLRIYGKDFDNNGSMDPYVSMYIPDSTGIRQEYLYGTRDDIIRQCVPFRKRFVYYGQLGDATTAEVLTPEMCKGAITASANQMASCFVENLGNGNFRLIELPVEAQFSPVFGIQPVDFNLDGLPDLLLTGNYYGMELLQGRADAGLGLALQNTGKGHFKPLSIEKSGFCVPGDARDLTQVQLANGKKVFLAAQRNASLRTFRLRE